MRMLIGAACVAAIGFVAYFFWGEWREYRSAQEREARVVETAMEKLMYYTGATADDMSKAETYCEDVKSNIRVLSGPGADEVRMACRSIGF